jgi:Tol biopolymer transport system component
MNADGSGQRALTDTGRWSGTYVYDELPSWSPDGTKIAFQSNRGDVVDYGIWVIGSDGRFLHHLDGNTSGDGDYSPAWSPDGSKIAFESDNGDSYDLYLMAADGTLIKRLTRTDDDEDSPAWSPDGTKIVYTRWRDGFSKLWLMNADGSNQHPLTRGGTDEFNPHFSPDGTKILFASDRGGNFDLYTLNADGSGSPVQLTSSDAAEVYPSWQPLVANGSPPLPASTVPAATNDAPLVGEIFSRGLELAAIQQAIFEARSRTSAARRAAFKRLLTSATQTAHSLAGEQPTSQKGKRLRGIVVAAWQQLALEGRERVRAMDAAQRGNRKAQKRHQRAANKADSRASDLFDSAGELIG